MRPRLAAAAAGLAAVLVAPTARAAGALVVDNQSQHAIKAAAIGGEALIESGTEPMTITFDSDSEIGVDLKIWWTSQPRELCQLFVPWNRTVVVTGSRSIRCRSR